MIKKPTNIGYIRIFFNSRSKTDIDQKKMSMYKKRIHRPSKATRRLRSQETEKEGIRIRFARNVKRQDPAINKQDGEVESKQPKSKEENEVGAKQPQSKEKHEVGAKQPQSKEKHEVGAKQPQSKEEKFKKELRGGPVRGG